MKVITTTEAENLLKSSSYGIYFLSNLYDDDVILDTLKTFNHFYNTDLYGEVVTQNNYMKSGNAEEIRVNTERNYKYGIDPDTYSVKIPLDMVPWYSEKHFIEKFGYGKVISSMDIMKNGTVFAKSLFLFIGEWFVYNVEYAIEKDYLIAFIPHVNHLRDDDIRQKIQDSEKWRFLATTKATIYETYSPRSVLVTEGNRIYLSKLNKVSSQHTFHDRESGWTLYMNDSMTSPNIMTGTHVMLKQDESGDHYFEIPSGYKDYIYQKTPTMKCLIVNEPDCAGSGIYMAKEGNSPIFQIPYRRVPVPVENLLIWEYDLETNRKLYPLKQSVTLKYPNIYDFSNVDMKNGIYVEWIEPDATPRKLDTPFQDYIDFCQNGYSQKVLTHTAPTGVGEYEPASPLPFMEEKYLDSSLFGDYRGWKVTQMVYLMKDNPNRYRTLFSQLYRKNMRYMSATYTPETYPDIYSRSILTNGIHCPNDEHAIIFNKPHSYIRVNNPSWRYRHCSIFFNGVRKIPTYIMAYEKFLYVYFPTEWIGHGETIQLDTGLINDTIHTDDIPFQFLYMNSTHRCANDNFSRNHALSDVMFYDERTKEILTDAFDVKLGISIYDIQYKNRDLNDEISFLDTEAELFAKNGSVDPLVFSSEKFDFFITKRKEIDYPLNTTTRMSHKNIDLRNLVLTNPKKEKYIRKPLHIATTDFYGTYVHDFTGNQESFGLIEFWEQGSWNRVTETYDPLPVYTTSNEMGIASGGVLKIKHYTGAHKKGHFRIFSDGKLLNPSQFQVTFPKTYGGECVIQVNSVTLGYTIIDYLPYEETVIYNGPIGNLRKTSDDILYLHDHLCGCSFDPLVCRIYIDGIRVSEDDIAVLGSGTSIAIRSDNYSYTNTSTIIIFQQTMDYSLSPYEYTKNIGEYLMYDTALITGPQEYRDWVTAKYL